MPASTGPKPATTWRCTTSRKKIAPNPAYTTKVTAFAARNCPSAKAWRGSIGWATRRSTSTNARPARSPRPPIVAVVASTPRSPAEISAQLSAPSASAPRAAPRPSTRPSAWGSCDSGTWRSVTQTTRAASGTLTRKTQRHEPSSTSPPPTNGPIAVATPPSPDQAPIARARSFGPKEAWIIARLPGVSSAPPTPCSARAATRAHPVGARPHTKEARANHTTPTRKTRRRPYRSPSTPPSRMNAASVSA